MNYATLKSDILDWLRRDGEPGMMAQLDGLIRLAEDRHKWGANGEPGIRVRDMTDRYRATVTDKYFPLPAEFLEMRRLHLLANRAEPLILVSPQGLPDNGNDAPKYFAVTKELEFDTDAGGEMEMIYYRAFTPLSDANPTNWLVENAYGCYLFGALSQASAYDINDERIPMWESKYQDAVNSVNMANERGRRNQSRMRTLMQRRYTP